MVYRWRTGGCAEIRSPACPLAVSAAVLKLSGSARRTAETGAQRIERVLRNCVLDYLEIGKDAVASVSSSWGGWTQKCFEVSRIELKSRLICYRVFEF